MLILSKSIVSTQDQIINFGPFPNPFRELKFVELGFVDLDGAVGNGQAVLHVSRVDVPALVSLDLDQGVILAGSLSGIDVWLPHVGGTASGTIGSLIPLTPIDVVNKYIAVRIVMVSTSVRGWVGLW